MFIVCYSFQSASKLAHSKGFASAWALRPARQRLECGDLSPLSHPADCQSARRQISNLRYGVRTPDPGVPTCASVVRAGGLPAGNRFNGLASADPAAEAAGDFQAVTTPG